MKVRKLLCLLWPLLSAFPVQANDPTGSQDVLLPPTVKREYQSNDAMSLFTKMTEMNNEMFFAPGYSLNMSVEVPMVPTIKLSLYHRGDRDRMDVQNTSMYLHGDTVWIYDKEKNKVVIGDRKDAEITFGSPFKEKKEVPQLTPGKDGKTFNDGKYTYTYREEGPMIVYNGVRMKGNKDENAPKNIVLGVNRKTGLLSMMKAKGGVVSATIRFSGIKKDCPESDVVFDASLYPDIQIETQPEKE